MRHAGLFILGLAVLLAILDLVAVGPNRTDTVVLSLSIAGAALVIGSVRSDR